MTRFSLGAMDSLHDHVLRSVGRGPVAREGGSGAMRHMSSAAPCGDARRGLMKLANNNPTSMRSVVGQSNEEGGATGDSFCTVCELIIRPRAIASRTTSPSL